MSKENARARARTNGRMLAVGQAANGVQKREIKARRRREGICTHSSHRGDKRLMFARGANTLTETARELYSVLCRRETFALKPIKRTMSVR